MQLIFQISPQTFTLDNLKNINMDFSLYFLLILKTKTNRTFQRVWPGREVFGFKIKLKTNFEMIRQVIYTCKRTFWHKSGDQSFIAAFLQQLEWPCWAQLNHFFGDNIFLYSIDTKGKFQSFLSKIAYNKFFLKLCFMMRLIQTL